MTGEIDNPGSEQFGRIDAQLFEPPPENKFSLHLRWHIEINGTRPDGVPGTPGKPWEPGELVSAIDKARRKKGGRKQKIEVAGDASKNVRNWLAGKRCYPYWRIVLEEVFFGDNGAYGRWRLRFREAASWRGTDEVTSHRLTASKLSDLPLAAHAAINARAVAISPGRGAPPLRLGRPSEGHKAIPLTAAWFVYTERAIPLLGREKELDKLRGFANSTAHFSWWIIGGPAGVGKSRLSQEFMEGLDQTWSAGFAEVSALDKVESHIAASDQNIFCAVDYASMAPEAVGRLINNCQGIDAPGRRIRILLLERDVSEAAQWLRRLASPFTARAATIEAGRFDSPLELSSLRGRERDIVTAWLDAAGLDQSRLAPKKRDHFWIRLRRLTESRPLHLGLAAAALSRGEKNFASIVDLLAGLLMRESVRWSTKAGSAERLADSLDALATGTAAWGLAIPWDGTLAEWFVVVRPDDTQKQYLPKKYQGRSPSYEELLADPDTRPMAERLILERVEDVAGIMRPNSNTTEFIALLEQVRDLTGGSWRLGPDLVAEAFLAEYWGSLTGRPGRRVLPCASDDAMKAQLRSAWHLRPLAVVFTLEQLRARPWAVAAFVRALTILVDQVVIAGNADKDAAEGVAGLLHDATIRLGGTTTSAKTKSSLLELLRHVSEAYPQFPFISYVYWRRLEASLLDVSSEQRKLVIAELFRRIPQLLNVDLLPENAFMRVPGNVHLHAMDVIIGFTRIEEQSANVNNLEQGMRLVNRILESTSHSVEMRSLEAIFYRSVSSVDRPDGPEVAVEKHDRLMNNLEMAVMNLAGTELGINSNTRRVLCEALSNLSDHSRKRGDRTAVRRVDGAFDAVWSGALTEENVREARIRILTNLLLVESGANDLSAGRAAFSRACALLTGNGGNAEAWIMEMLNLGLSSALNLWETEEVAFYLKNLFEAPWNLNDELTRKQFIKVLWNIEERIGATCKDDLIHVAGAIIEPSINRDAVYDLLWEALRKQPIENETRAETEQHLEHLLTYIQAAGLSRAMEIKLGRRLAYYTWRFGDTFPEHLRKIWTFCVRRKGTVVEVEYPKGAFPGIVTRLPFDFSSC